MTRALLIANPVAARAGGTAVSAVRDVLRGAGWRLDVLATHRSGDARRFAEEARTAGCDAVITYGGDGTAMQAAAALVHSGTALGIVPAGTGNLLAGNLRIPRRPEAAAQALLTARPRPLDLGAVERADGTHYFAVAAGAGFDAELMAATAAADKQKWKMGAYIARALAALPSVTSTVQHVTVDDVTHEVPAAMVLIANCGEIVPPLVRLGPQVVPDDGWLDIVAVRADGVVGSLAALTELLSGIATGAAGPRLWTARGRTVTVAPLDGATRPVELDGEVAGTTPFTARLLPHALQVLAPAGEGS